MGFIDFVSAALLGLFTTAIFFAINGLLLKLISGWLKFHDDSWATAYKVSGIASAISWVLSLIPTAFTATYTVMGRVAMLIINALFAIINAAILIWLIYRLYRQPLGKSVLAWLMVFVANLLLSFLIGLIVAALAVALAFNAARFV